MAILTSKTRNQVLLRDVKVATGFIQRGVGLLGHTKLEAEEALWIDPCQSIHTFFMSFPIDAVFVDAQMRIQKIYHSLPPWRMTTLVWGARSVIEMPSGKAKHLGLAKGEVLDVGAENP